MGFLLRWVAAFGLLSATYNPTRWNYTRWAQTQWGDAMPMIVLTGLLLGVGYIIYLRATLRSIGVFGMALVLAIVAAALWVLSDYGVIRLDNPGTNTWIVLAALATVLGTGLNWSHLRRRLSGQADMDDLDD